MMPAANSGVGMNMGFPDVCTTPAAPSPIPIPYPNMGMNATAMPFVPNVLVSMAPAQNMGSKPLLTNGDNAGVAHPLFMQPGGTTMGNPMVLMGGMPASHLCNPTYGNNFNNPVGSKLVPSVTNVLLGSTATLEPTAIQAGAAALHAERGEARLLRHGILTLRLPCVSLHSDRWLRKQLHTHATSVVHGIVLDLRSNPGGSVAVAMNIADQLASCGLPVAIVADHRTASAAEILVAMLHDHDRIVTRTFGDRTYGKGRVQSFWLTPTSLVPSSQTTEIMRADGRDLDRVGVHPDTPCRNRTAPDEAIRWLRTRR